MSLSGLLDAVLPDPALSRAVSSAGLDSLELTAPAALRPFVVSALATDPSDGGAGRPVLAVTATSREAEDLVAALRCLLPARRGRRLSVLGDAAARAALARARTPSAGGWRCCAGSPTRAPATRRPGRCAWSSRRSGPCCSRRCPGLGDLEPVEARVGDASTSRTSLERLVDGRLRPGRPGHQARRVRRPRRHPRRLPADRGAPGPGRVLGRRGRGDPLLRRRRPAHPRPGRPTAVGAAVPGAAADPDRCASGPPQLAAEHPELAEMLDKLAEGIPSRAWSRWPRCCVDDLQLLLLDCCRPAPTCCSATRSGSGPGPHDLVRTSEEFLQASWARRPAAARRRSTSARPRFRDRVAQARERRRRRWASRGGR